MQDNSIARRFGSKIKAGQGSDQPLPNRAQRRAQERHRKSQQRRGQKAFDRQQRAQERAQVEAQRALIRDGWAVQAFWNGLPTFATRGTAVVTGIGGLWIGTATGDPENRQVEHGEDPIGKRTRVVAVNLDGVNAGGGTVYLYDEDGSGWRKVTEGHGSPAYPHREVLVDELTFDLLSKVEVA